MLLFSSLPHLCVCANHLRRLSTGVQHVRKACEGDRPEAIEDSLAHRSQEFIWHLRRRAASEWTILTVYPAARVASCQYEHSPCQYEHSPCHRCEGDPSQL